MKSRMGYTLFYMIYQPMRKGNTRLIVLLANDDQLKQQRPVIELLHSLNDMNIVTRGNKMRNMQSSPTFPPKEKGFDYNSFL